MYKLNNFKLEKILWEFDFFVCNERIEIVNDTILFEITIYGNMKIVQAWSFINFEHSEI